MTKVPIFKTHFSYEAMYFGHSSFDFRTLFRNSDFDIRIFR